MAYEEWGVVWQLLRLRVHECGQAGRPKERSPRSWTSRLSCAVRRAGHRGPTLSLLWVACLTCAPCAPQHAAVSTMPAAVQAGHKRLRRVWDAPQKGGSSFRSLSVSESLPAPFDRLQTDGSFPLSRVQTRRSHDAFTQQRHHISQSESVLSIRAASAAKRKL
jgi:hypothetical protein